ncbi:MAG: LPS export ABC transporter periplasmic protein LptC [Acidobacteriota bacterium]|nr:LPS export ABC transporter periplasmic protein LptC [Acidobacteriota bacterium]
MRSVRPLILLAILFILVGVGTTWYARFKAQATSAPARPKSLPPGISASAQGWSYTKMAKDKPVVSVFAKEFEEVEGKYRLKGIELHLFQKGGPEYDLVKSASAEFDIKQGILYSDGDVEITMGVRPNEPPSGRLMQIRSSGVHFETKTGKATTDRLASFQFDRGEGHALGGAYDPSTHELVMRSQVQMLWRGQDGKARPMKVEAGDVTYKEKESKVFLGQWSKMTRDTLTLNAGPAVVTLLHGEIQLVEAQKAEGKDLRPGREVIYAADQLVMTLDDNREVNKIVGTPNARLDSNTETAHTHITADRVDLDFDTSGEDSKLQTALATGHSVLTSTPVAHPGAADVADTRILRSEVIKTRMRAGGQEIDNLETLAPGSLEFTPNRPTQPHRLLNGDRIWVTYGAKNQIQSFRSINVSTRTDKPKLKDAKEPPPPAFTWSKDMTGEFQPNSSQLAKLEQWNDFRYEEGDRKARAEKAFLDQVKNRIYLTGAAKVWDPTGSTSSSAIVLDQSSGDFTADGNVNSIHMPEKKKERKKDASGGGSLLADDEPLHAKARRMTSTESNQQVRYEGNAILWQGANRLQADAVEIDRENEVVKAHGHVISELIDKPKGDEKTEAAAKTKKMGPVFTVVKAPEMVYRDEDRLAHYTGGVILDRPDMKVRSQELRAFLRDDDNDSSLDHAFADGKVQIVQAAPKRTRTGTSEHAEYYVDEDKVILNGGQPLLVDSLKGRTRGEELIWFSLDDRLLVNGAEGQPAKSLLHRK